MKELERLNKRNVRWVYLDSNNIKQLILCDNIVVNDSDIIVSKIDGNDVDHYIYITFKDPEIIYLNKSDTKVDSLKVADSVIIYDDNIKVRLYLTYTDEKLLRSILC